MLKLNILFCRLWPTQRNTLLYLAICRVQIRYNVQASSLQTLVEQKATFALLSD